MVQPPSVRDGSPTPAPRQPGKFGRNPPLPRARSPAVKRGGCSLRQSWAQSCSVPTLMQPRRKGLTPRVSVSPSVKGAQNCPNMLGRRSDHCRSPRLLVPCPHPGPCPWHPQCDVFRWTDRHPQRAWTLLTQAGTQQVLKKHSH